MIKKTLLSTLCILITVTNIYGADKTKTQNFSDKITTLSEKYAQIISEKETNSPTDQLAEMLKKAKNSRSLTRICNEYTKKMNNQTMNSQTKEIKQLEEYCRKEDTLTKIAAL